MRMSEKAEGGIESAKAKVEEALTKIRETDSKVRFLLVNERDLTALTNVLSESIRELGSNASKEMLVDVEAGLRWMIKNSKSISREERESLLKSLSEQGS